MLIKLLAQIADKNTNKRISSTYLCLLCALFFVVFYNTSFFAEIFALIDYTSIRGAVFIVNIATVLWLLTYIILLFVTMRHSSKIILSLLFFLGASAAYFMDSYGIVIHRLMIQNVMETDTEEAKALINLSFVLYLLILGALPSLLLVKVDIRYHTIKMESWKKIKYSSAAFIACLLLIISMSTDYASFFRNHKNIRQMANPLSLIYAGISYITTSHSPIKIEPIENDATINRLGKNQSKPTLLILVVGETARADHFGINGYERDTTPLIAQQNIINYPKVTSCGTETAVSVPCMFSNLGRSNYSDKKGKTQQGLLDVIQHAGINVLWRDNNSSCKGTCDRVAYEDRRALTLPEFCNDRECFDPVLLHKLEEKIANTAGSWIIVLHQKGSHGPDYFNRHPQDMDIFKPECKSNQLQHCEKQQVINAYDNTIRYTDYFLHKTIEWLKSQSSQYNTSLVYLSDHGESLGENNLYLHGMPYAIAPDAQKHVPFFLWLSNDFSHTNAINSDCLKNTSNADYSQDNLFHTVLGMLNIETQVYRKEMDIIMPCRQQAVAVVLASRKQ